MSQPLNVAIVGAGITGLAAAYRLKKKGCQITLFEESDAVGGNIRGSVDDNWLADSGYGLLNTTAPNMQDLISDLDLRDELIAISPLFRRRYIAYGGKLRRMPNTLRDAIWSGYLPFGSRTRLMFSRFIKKSISDKDSLSAVLERFLGPSAVSLMAEPLASTLFAGNPNDLNFKYAFPNLYRHLSEKKSIGRSFKLSLKDKKLQLDNPMLMGFRFGMPTLTNALADQMIDETVRGARVVQIKRHQHQWLLTIHIGSEVRYFVCDKVILAAPAHALPEILVGDNPDADLQSIGEMPYAPLAVLNMGFRKSDLANKLDSAGFVVHKSESNSLLGVMFTSSLLAERTPGGNHLITVFVGGTENAAFASEPVNKIKTAVLKDLNKYLGVKAYPVYVKSFVYSKGIPQFTGAYSAIAQSIKDFEQRNKGVHLVGQYRFGPGVESCIQGAFSMADNLIASSSAELD